MAHADRRTPAELIVAHRPPPGPAPRRFYVVGGNLHPKDPSYVERQADHDLYEALCRGEFCYVLTARQMGKSSLMVHTAARLRAEGVAVATVDLTGIGRSLAVDQWYDGLLRHIAEDLDLEAELDAFWHANPRLGPLQRWVTALREVVLPHSGVQAFGRSGVQGGPSAGPEHLNTRTPEHLSRLVIFVDEIDAVRSLPFSTDEFFAGLRECYNRRATEPAFQRLTFCLLGTATPGDLVRDTRTTPFNIGRRIELTDFTEAEAAPLAAGLPGVQAFGRSGVQAELTPGLERLNARTPERLLKRILHWTGGHPCLTQRLCAAVAEEGRSTRFAGTRTGDGRRQSPEDNLSALPTADYRLPSPPDVDRLCRRLFLTPEARDRDDNLLFVRDYLLRNDTDPAGLLELYARVRRGRYVRDDPTSRLVSILRLSGLVRPIAGSLRVRNRIYERVFNQRWITEHMPDAELRRQRAAYRRGLWRATAVSVAVLIVVVGLALDAVRQTGRADRSARRATDRARALRAALLQADRAANQARAAAEGERLQRLQVDATRRRAEAAEGKAKQESRRATRQQQIAEERQAEAEQERQRERRAQQNATDKLWRSYLSEARALRFSGRAGRRFQALAALSHAAAIRPSLALRNEAIASMSLADIRLEKHRIICPVIFVSFDPGYTRYAYEDGHGGISIRRLADNGESLHLPGIGIPSSRVGIFSNTGRFLSAYCGPTPKGIAICVWDLSQTRLVVKLEPGLAPTGREAFSSDDRQVAVGLEDGSIRLYELPSGREINHLAPGPPIYSLAIRPDGRQLAVSSVVAHVVQLRDIDTGRVVRSLAHPAAVKGIAWSPDGRLLAVACDDSRVYVWDGERGEQLRALEGHRVGVIDVRFSHESDLLSSWTWDETFRVWDPLGGREVASLHDVLAHGGFSPDDRLVGSSSSLWLPGAHGGGKETVSLLRLVPGAECRTLYPSMDLKNVVGGVGFSPDGRLLAASSQSGVSLWSAATGRKLDSKPCGALRSALFDPQGSCLITAGDPGIDRWPILVDRAAGTHPEGTRLGSSRRLSGGSRWAALNRDGRTLVSVEAGRVHVLDRGDPARTAFLDGPPNALAVAISPDGRWLSASSGAGTIPVTEERTRVWDLQHGSAGRDLPVRGRAQVAFSPDGRWLVTGGIQEYRFWRTGSWQPGLRIPRLSRAYQSGPAAFSRDGAMLAIARSPQLAQLIDPTNGQELATLEVPNPEALMSFAFSPDGSRLAAGTSYGWFYLWDLRLIRRQLKAMGLDWSTPVQAVRLSLAVRPSEQASSARSRSKGRRFRSTPRQ